MVTHPGNASCVLVDLQRDDLPDNVQKLADDDFAGDTRWLTIYRWEMIRTNVRMALAPTIALP